MNLGKNYDLGLSLCTFQTLQTLGVRDVDNSVRVTNRESRMAVKRAAALLSMVASFFGGLWRIFYLGGLHEPWFGLRSCTRKWYPHVTTLPMPWGHGNNIANSLLRGSISMKMALRKIGKRGGRLSVPSVPLVLMDFCVLLYLSHQSLNQIYDANFRKKHVELFLVCT